MATTMTEGGLLAAINLALKAETERVVEEIANEAAEKARREVRAKVGAIACSLLSEYSLTRDGRDLLIRVQMKEGTEK